MGVGRQGTPRPLRSSPFRVAVDADGYVRGERDTEPLPSGERSPSVKRDTGGYCLFPASRSSARRWTSSLSCQVESGVRLTGTWSSYPMNSGWRSQVWPGT